MPFFFLFFFFVIQSWIHVQDCKARWLPVRYQYFCISISEILIWLIIKYKLTYEESHRYLGLVNSILSDIFWSVLRWHHCHHSYHQDKLEKCLSKNKGENTTTVGSKTAKDCLIVRNSRQYSDFLQSELVTDMSCLKLMDGNFTEVFAISVWE